MSVQTRVKERAEEQATAMTAEQQATIRMVANDLHRLNQSVMKAVDAGVVTEQRVEQLRFDFAAGGPLTLAIKVFAALLMNPGIQPACRFGQTGITFWPCAVHMKDGVNPIGDNLRALHCYPITERSHIFVIERGCYRCQQRRRSRP
eukprot:gene4115-4866_t